MTEDTNANAGTPPAAQPIYAEVVLPSGKRAVLKREPMGHDMEKAYDLAPNAGNMITISMALFAVAKGELNGKRVTYEDLRHELSGLDAYRLASWTNAGFELIPAPDKKGQEPASPL
jgi:hypothetical protein